MKTRLVAAALLLAPALAVAGSTAGSEAKRIGPPVVVAVDSSRAMACGRMTGEIEVLDMSVETLINRDPDFDSYSLAALASDIYNRTTYIKSHALGCKCPSVTGLIDDVEMRLGKITGKYSALEKAPPVNVLREDLAGLSLSVSTAKMLAGGCRQDVERGLP